MIDSADIFKSLKRNKVDFFVGVPDSLLKHFSAYIEKKVLYDKHITAANEGNAVSIATGYHLATKKIPLVYLQNSGLGNCINPLTSLTNKEVYSIPMLLLIGWRGEPGVKDEPQHLKQGSILKDQLKLLNIKYYFINKKSNIKQLIDKAYKKTKESNLPVALIVSKDTFKENMYKTNKQIFNNNISRYESIKYITSKFKNDLVVSTTGKTSRELFEIRKEDGETCNDFLTIGSMGHASSIALGVSLGQSKKGVVCIDGDGSLIMHLGSMAVIGTKRSRHFRHFLINNGCHDSVGGQISAGSEIDFCKIARACGYSLVRKCRNLTQLSSAIKESKNNNESSFIEIQVNKNSKENLGRPNNTTYQNKFNFTKFVNKI